MLTNIHFIRFRQCSYMLGLFDKLILTILTYGSEVSGFSKADNIDRIHLQFCKHLLGVKIQTQNISIYGELGRVPVRNYRLIAANRYWFKILECDGIICIILVYNMMIEDLQCSAEKPSWAKSVELLLESLGFSHVWIEQGVGDFKSKRDVLRVFKQRLTDNFIQGWNEQISITSRANTYELIANFSFKCYLDVVTVQKFRYAFTRL